MGEDGSGEAGGDGERQGQGFQVREVEKKNNAVFGTVIFLFSEEDEQ